MRLSDASQSALTRAVSESVTDGVRLRVEAALREAVRAGASSPSRSAAGASPAPVTAELRAAVIELERAQKGTESAIAWGYAYRTGVLMVPYVVALVMVMTLIVPVAEITGVGPLSRWAWGSFQAAESWGTKTWIALATLTVLAGLGYAVYRGGKALVESYSAYHRLLVTAKK